MFTPTYIETNLRCYGLDSLVIADRPPDQDSEFTLAGFIDHKLRISRKEYYNVLKNLHGINGENDIFDHKDLTIIKKIGKNIGLCNIENRLFHEYAQLFNT